MAKASTEDDPFRTARREAVLRAYSAEELLIAQDVCRAPPPLGERLFGTPFTTEKRPLSIDAYGKRLRGSQHETSPGVHMLHAFSTKLRAAVGALKVPPDSGECIEALELIKSLPLEGALVTGDAAFTTEAIAKAIRERGGHYFLFVKDNQPELVSELERAFGDLPPCRDHVSGAGPHRRQAA